jgi:hypothetical protein
MKKIIYGMALSLPVFLLWFCTSSTTVKTNDTKKEAISSVTKDAHKNMAVLELFTSQGCSSCPPADKLIGSYTSKANVIPLSFHVDYWDRLGWKDPFSSREYSDRQRMYASALKSNVYTPQLVINGQEAMIGSDANKLSAALQKIFSATPAAALSIKKAEEHDGKINISFDVSGTVNNLLLNIAILENKTTTQVKAGENGGATLTDYNVVRVFKTINQFNEGENNFAIDLPVSLDQKNRTLVLYLQKKDSHKITAADKMEF